MSKKIIAYFTDAHLGQKLVLGSEAFATFCLRLLWSFLFLVAGTHIKQRSATKVDLPDPELTGTVERRRANLPPEGQVLPRPRNGRREAFRTNVAHYTRARSRSEEGKAVLWENGQYQWAGGRIPLPRNAAELFCLQNTCGTKSESFASSSIVLHSLTVRPA